jgi:hypothetical protein
VFGESEPDGPAHTHPGCMQFVGKTCDDAVIVQVAVGVAVVDVGGGLVDGCAPSQRLGAFWPAGPAHTQPGCRQFVGVTCDEAVIVQVAGCVTVDGRGKAQ